jgi:hypothetical protein
MKRMLLPLFVAVALAMSCGEPETGEIDVSTCQLTATGLPRGGRVTNCAHDFGEIRRGTTATLDFEIANLRYAPLLVKDVDWLEDVSGFSVETNPSTPTSVDIDRTLPVRIRFSPTLTGLQTARLFVASDAENFGDVQITLSAIGR